MVKNFFKVAYRNLMRNKFFSLINITGLAIGMACAILILLWIQNEVSYDQFHPHKDRIYEAWNRAVFSGKLESWATTPKILAKTLQKDYPEVEYTARMNWQSNNMFAYGEKKLSVQGNTADSSFFDVFNFPFIKGDPHTALNGLYSIVLTQKLARKLFGDEDPMGKVLKMDNKDNFTVTGVMKDLPNNTRFEFEYVLPWAYMRANGGDDEYWGNNSTQTFVRLKENATLASIEPKLKHIRAKYDRDDPKGEMFLYPITRWRLHSQFVNGIESGGLIEFV
ncbi:MAG: ABC transporter permease, partial [Bacteroidetes bacterium]